MYLLLSLGVQTPKLRRYDRTIKTYLKHRTSGGIWKTIKGVCVTMLHTHMFIYIYGSVLGGAPPLVFLLVYRLVESIYLLCLAVSRLKGV